MSVKPFSIKKFTENFYEKKEARFSTQNSLFDSVTAQDAFDMSLECVKSRRETGHRYVRLYVDNKLIQNERSLNRWFPKAADQNFFGYRDRMSQQLNGKEYYFVVGDLHASDRSFYHRLIDFAEELAQFVGRSRRRVDTQLFVGNASRTPFGIHNDAAGVFHIPLVGTKKMRFWNEDYVKHNPTVKYQLDFQEHLEGSTSLEAEPGEMLYWPSRLWHIAESNGAFGITWGLGWWNGDHRTQLLENEVRRLIVESIDRGPATEKQIARYSHQIEGNDFQRVMRRLSGNDFKERGHQIDVEYLKVMSNFGFWTFPGAQNIRLTPASRFSFAKRFKTMFYDLAPGITAIICNGDSITIKSSSQIQPILREFRHANIGTETRKPFEVGKLVKRLETIAEKKEVMKLLNFIAAREGLQIEGK